MFRPFLDALRGEGVPVSLREYLDFLAGLGAGVAGWTVDGVYQFGRMSLVKDERHIDRYDRAFAAAFAGLEAVPVEALLESRELPREPGGVRRRDDGRLVEELDAAQGRRDRE